MNKEVVVRQTNTLRVMLESPEMRKRLRDGLPNHLDEQRLIRAIMAAVGANPALLECSRSSFLAAVMACAQLGLEPEPVLGQAYLVPFKNQVVFIPGYRGYIALARRSGEVRSVSSQVVYRNDRFRLQYGTEEILEHVPTEGDRGEPTGAYVVFRYRDGGHSFDYMTTADINRVRDNFSKQPGGLMWKENWTEAAKKTVIRRHVKLVPLAVEIQRAAALEDRVYGGESQFDIVFPEPAATGTLPPTRDFDSALDDYCQETNRLIPIKKNLDEFVEITAQANEMSIEDLKNGAAVNMEGFLKQYDIWIAKDAGKEGPKEELPFKGLKKPGLIRWEEQNRERIPAMAEAIRKAFYAKWEKVMGKPYHEEFKPKEEPTEPDKNEPEVPEYKGQKQLQEGKQETSDIIMCPDRNMEVLITYCSEHCTTYQDCKARPK